MVATELSNYTIPSASSSRLGPSKPTQPFDIIQTYNQAFIDEEVPQPIAAILSLTHLIQRSSSTTLSGLLTELMEARQKLVESTSSLGVRAGCQLFERFVGFSGAGEDFPSHKSNLIQQGLHFCQITAPECRSKIADLMIGFLDDDCVILTHSYSRTVMQSLLKAHERNKRIKVYVTEGRPGGLGLKTHNLLTSHHIPSLLLLDSAITYILPSISLLLLGTEVVVESGGLVSSLGTAQMATLGKGAGKPVYVVAESYKFLRYYPLGVAELPGRRRWDADSGKFVEERPLGFDELDKDVEDEDDDPSPIPATPSVDSVASTPATAKFPPIGYELTPEQIAKNPLYDITTPDLIDFVITDLGALSPTSVSQYLVAQFSS